MSGIKGFPSQQKLVQGQASKADFVTVQPTADFRNALDAHARYAFRVGSATVARTAITGTGNPDAYGTYINDTATPALAGDFVRFETGLAQYLEIPIVENYTDGFRLAARLPNALLPAGGDTFFILRMVTQRMGSDGSQTVNVSSAPLNYTKNSATQNVIEDTTTIANSVPLPVRQLSGYLNSARIDYSSTAVSNAAWTQVLASVGATPVNGVTIFDGGGFAMELGIGAAASEARTLLIPPGGFNGVIPITIPAGSRLSIRAVGNPSVASGEFCINIMR